MPRSCSICNHPETARISKELLAGGSLRSVAERYKLGTHAAVGRHLRNCLRTRRIDCPEKAARTNKGARVEKTARFGSKPASAPPDGRCATCGFLADSPEPQAMMRRSERALHVGEEIVLRAQANDDDRTALMGLDRVHRSLELCMKAVGMIGPDSTTVVVTQAERARMTVKEALEVILAAIPSEAMQTAVLDVVVLATGKAAELPPRSRSLLALPPAS
jgi:hypothetical protein